MLVLRQEDVPARLLRLLHLCGGVLCALSASCGGGTSPVAPTTPPPASSAAFDGWTSAPVVATFAPGPTLTATAPGYLPRVQVTAARVFLWPGDEAYVRTMVYSDVVPGRLLSRWAAAFTIRPLPGHEDEATWAAAQAALATDLPIAVATAGAVTVEIDPATIDTVSPTALAAAVRTFKGNELTGCRIVYRDERRTSRATLTHELGHCLGLAHSTLIGDLMYAQEQRGVDTYSAAELVLLRMMYRHRAAGNAAPDREAGVAAAGQRVTIAIID